MTAILLMIIGFILFVTTGLGYVIFGYIFMGILEVGAALFSGLIGFILLGLVISWILTKFNNHS